MAWYDADPAGQVVDARFNELLDRIIAAYEAAWPEGDLLTRR
jgi:microcystin degradation protein MlrC